MKHVEAKTIDDAYVKAAQEFECSVRELDIKIIQSPSNGFLGTYRRGNGKLTRLALGLSSVRTALFSPITTSSKRQQRSRSGSTAGRSMMPESLGQIPKLIWP